MKYVSVLILLLLMGWTWSLATSEPSFSLSDYKRVESGVEQDIRAFIQRKYPQTKDIFCTQLYSEVVVPGQEMVAHFRCQADDSNAEPGAAPSSGTEQIFEGEISLKSDNGFDTWSETGGRITSPEIRFLNGLKISPKSAEPPKATGEPQ